MFRATILVFERSTINHNTTYVYIINLSLSLKYLINQTMTDYVYLMIRVQQQTCLWSEFDSFCLTLRLQRQRKKRALYGASFSTLKHKSTDRNNSLDIYHWCVGSYNPLEWTAKWHGWFTFLHALCLKICIIYHCLHCWKSFWG